MRFLFRVIGFKTTFAFEGYGPIQWKSWSCGYIERETSKDSSKQCQISRKPSQLALHRWKTLSKPYNCAPSIYGHGKIFNVLFIHQITLKEFIGSKFWYLTIWHKPVQTLLSCDNRWPKKWIRSKSLWWNAWKRRSPKCDDTIPW